MILSSQKRKLIFLTGPTASGKTQLAVQLARNLKGVVFNCDSIQVYRDLNIGSAKPTLEERGQVPHYLFDLMQAPEIMTAGLYRDFFQSQLHKIDPEVPVIVVGGTGFYFLALEKGMFDIPETPAQLKLDIQKEFISQGHDLLRFWREIESRDPQQAQKIHPNDEYRILRAIEILRNNPAVTMTELFKQKEQQEKPFQVFKINLNLEVPALESRIRARTQALLERGLIEEVRPFLDKGLGDWSPLGSVGYKEAKLFLEGVLPKSELFEKIVISTRQLAKKQRTWFQRDKGALQLQANSLNLEESLYPQLARFLQDG